MGFWKAASPENVIDFSSLNSSESNLMEFLSGLNIRYKLHELTYPY